ncbi:MAG: hypothetical protein ACR2H3_02630 [Acidimicrobiales bacterium]
MTDVLALPSGATPASERERRSVATASLFASVAMVMAFAGFAAVYLTLRQEVRPFPPEGVEFDFYLARTLVITVFMASLFIEWAAYGIRKGFQGHALVAFAVTILQGIAAIIGFWFLLDTKLGFAIADHPYGALAHTMVFLSLLAVGAAIVFIELTMLKAIGHQLDARNFPLMRATATVWHAAATSWVIVYYVLYVTK